MPFVHRTSLRASVMQVVDRALVVVDRGSQADPRAHGASRAMSWSGSALDVDLADLARLSSGLAAGRTHPTNETRGRIRPDTRTRSDTDHLFRSAMSGPVGSSAK